MNRGVIGVYLKKKKNNFFRRFLLCCFLFGFDVNMFLIKIHNRRKKLLYCRLH